MDAIDLVYVVVGIVLTGGLAFLVKVLVFPLKINTVIGYYKQQKYKQAIAVAGKLIVKNPGNCDARYYLGRCYLAIGNDQQALEQFHKINNTGMFSRDCPESEFRKFFAGLLIKHGDWKNALQQYILLIRTAPERSEYYFEAGKLFEYLDNAPKAMEFYLKTIKMNEHHEEALLKLGILYYHKHDSRQALKAFQRILLVNKENTAASFWFGVLFKEKGDFKSALSYLEPAMRNVDYKVRAMIERGECFLRMDKVYEALPELERAVRLVNQEQITDYLNAKYFLALAYEKDNKLKEAAVLFKEVHSIKADFRDVAEKLQLQVQPMERAEDRIKDYITASKPQFIDICKILLGKIGLKAQNIRDIYGGCEIFADDISSEGRGPQSSLVWLLRISEPITESTIRTVHEKMKKENFTRAVVFSSSSFTTNAKNFAASRIIELITPQLIQKMLTG